MTAFLNKKDIFVIYRHTGAHFTLLAFCQQYNKESNIIIYKIYSSDKKPDSIKLSTFADRYRQTFIR